MCRWPCATWLKGSSSSLNLAWKTFLCLPLWSLHCSIKVKMIKSKLIILKPYKYFLGPHNFPVGQILVKKKKMKKQKHFHGKKKKKNYHGMYKHMSGLISPSPGAVLSGSFCLLDFIKIVLTLFLDKASSSFALSIFILKWNGYFWFPKFTDLIVLTARLPRARPVILEELQRWWWGFRAGAIPAIIMGLCEVLGQ